ncbi:hypothetical protein [Cellulosimicrobium protaetiae]|uniref:Uncharacterized protein n=1 Tax=Cellulosimicrobium protaetiae TaxID=2587808 RepID=A0A6M5UA35_9MICO|nr:hypothetical protein [Cellulosimicrobium protaetiae]QJW35080.1 hypothetical protein FIC82_001510 [Cellulosimicrobium protaetiae]
MTQPPDPSPTAPVAVAPSPDRRRRRVVLLVVAVLVLVLVGVVAVFAYLDQRPRLERQPNIDAVAVAYDECGLARTWATLDADNGSIDFDAVGTGVGPTWDDVECVGTALGMPDEHLARIQVTDDRFGQEQLRWDVYMVLRQTGAEHTHVSLYHDWHAASYRS